MIFHIRMIRNNYDQSENFKRIEKRIERSSIKLKIGFDHKDMIHDMLYYLLHLVLLAKVCHVCFLNSCPGISRHYTPNTLLLCCDDIKDSSKAQSYSWYAVHQFRVSLINANLCIFRNSVS